MGQSRNHLFPKILTVSAVLTNVSGIDFGIVRNSTFEGELNLPCAKEFVLPSKWPEGQVGDVRKPKDTKVSGRIGRVHEKIIRPVHPTNFAIPCLNNLGIGLKGGARIRTSCDRASVSLDQRR